MKNQKKNNEEMQQTNIFELLKEKYTIANPIRLIELFAGIGSQAKALKNLNVNFEHYKIVEFDKYAIASYNAIHGTNFETQDITKIGAKDLEIVDTDKYDYILTYSFPCTDLSLAGDRKGMTKGGGTRSGLLWEVERLLDECLDLPQILLMENVPQVVNSDFHEWQLKLESLGYSNYTDILNAKDYGIPQNRNRCFMVSILGDYSYTFPRKQKLELRLKDMLEDEVDERYYLPEKYLANITFEEKGNEIANLNYTTFNQSNIVHNIEKVSPTLRACMKDNDYLNTVNIALPIKEATKKGYAKAHIGDGVNISGRMQYQRGNVQKGMIQTIKTSGNDLGVVVKDKPIIPFGSYYTWEDNQGNINTQCNRSANPNESALTVACAEPGKVLNNLRIRKLTPLECFRLMGFSDSDFEKASKVNSNAQLYKQAGNSIVVNVLMEIFKELLC